MANKLRRDIPKGSKIVIAGQGDETHRTITVDSGSGIYADARGSTIWGKDCNNNFIKVDGFEVEKLIE